MQKVQVFKTNVDDILSKIEEGDHRGKADKPKDDDTSAVKSFEEIKVMVRDLSSNLEDRFSDGGALMRSRKFRKFHPMMIEELPHMLPMKSNDPFLGILIISIHYCPKDYFSQAVSRDISIR